MKSKTYIITTDYKGHEGPYTLKFEESSKRTNTTHLAINFDTTAYAYSIDLGIDNVDKTYAKVALHCYLQDNLKLPQAKSLNGWKVESK